MTKSRSIIKISLLVITILSLVLSYGCSNTSTPDSLNYDTASTLINMNRVKSHLEHLVEISPRITGTQGEIAAGEYIEEHFELLGYKPEKENFPIKLYTLNQVSFQTISNGQSTTYQPEVLTYSGSTPTGGLTDIPLVFAHKATQKDLTNLDLKNSIALVHRGDISFKEKSENCLAKGALGVVIINNEDIPLKGSLTEPSDIAVISLGRTQGLELINALSNGIVTANLLVDTAIEDGQSSNIVAVKESKSKDAKTLIIGAHYDSVDCPGADDNGSGTAALLELAEIFKDQSLDFNIKFIAFGAEEIGLKGSYYHVAKNFTASSQIDEVIGMINMDMIGTGYNPMVARSIGESSDVLSKAVVKAFSDIKIFPNVDLQGRSDHVPFEEAGIPVAFLITIPIDPRYYHTPEDTLDIIDYDNIENIIKGIIKTITQMQ